MKYVPFSSECKTPVAAHPIDQRSVALRGNWWGTEILEQQSAAGKTSAWRRQNKEGNKCADQPLTLKTVHQIGLRHFHREALNRINAGAEHEGTPLTDLVGDVARTFSSRAFQTLRIALNIRNLVVRKKGRKVVRYCRW
jgi:hypothetical protein